MDIIDETEDNIFLVMTRKEFEQKIRKANIAREIHILCIPENEGFGPVKIQN